MHTYKIVIVNGLTTRVYQDDVLLLSASTYHSLSDHASEPRILWGEGSSVASGQARSEWVRHNAHANGCVTAGVGPAAVVGALRVQPNPFGGSTALSFAVERAGGVRVEIFDASGRRVRRLLDQPLEPGMRTPAWDGTDDRGAALGAGTYLCRVTGDGTPRSSRIVRVR